ncbi:hypothetical protein VCRA219O19_80037 [Vibrio crassostreae]|nr:hypothetical protein VCRA219O19_80037 [Vibrio crassostreae]
MEHRKSDALSIRRRLRREQAGEDLAVIRHIALNLLTEETSFKAGIKRKQKKVNRSNSYFSQVLQGKGLVILS